MRKSAKSTPMRKSASAEASEQAQRLRISKMSVEERIKAALNMGKKYAWLKPAPTKR